LAGNRADFGVVATRDFDDEATDTAYGTCVPSDPTAIISTGIQLIDKEGHSAYDSQFK
jgi:hypothetical protein